jgi:hypothetical protein
MFARQILNGANPVDLPVHSPQIAEASSVLDQSGGALKASEQHGGA